MYKVTRGGRIKEVIQKKALDRLDIHSLVGRALKEIITDAELVRTVREILPRVIRSGWPATVVLRVRVGGEVVVRRCTIERYDGGCALVFVTPA